MADGGQKLSDFFGKSHLVYIDDDDEKIHSGTEGVFYVTLFDWKKLDESSKSNFVSHMSELTAYEACLSFDEKTNSYSWDDTIKLPVAIIAPQQSVLNGKVSIPKEFDIVVIKSVSGKGSFEIYRWGDPIEDIQKIGGSEKNVLKELKIDKAGLKKTQAKLKEREEAEEERRQAPLKLKEAIEAFQKGKVSWDENALGNGKASTIIVSTLEKILGETLTLE